MSNPKWRNFIRSESVRLHQGSLITDAGQPQFGQFDNLFSDLGIDKFKYFNEMDGLASRWAKYFHYKQFQFVCIVTPDYLIGIAIADIRYLGSGFCYLYEIESNTLHEESWLRPMNLGYQTTPSSSFGQASIHHNAIQFLIHEGEWRVKINTNGVQCDVQLTADQESYPLAMCTPTGYRGWTYTQKHNALGLAGELKVRGQTQDITRCLASYDFSAGYMRRETSWRWASLNAVVEGVGVGLNLAQGVNETGECENVLWIGNQRIHLGLVNFVFDRHKPYEQTWRVSTKDGRVDLQFKPINTRKEKMNVYFLKSNFRQFIGHFEGYVIDTSGHRVELNQVIGLVEDHYAKW
ncbi:DUF2804 domain-containing protein [Vibrio sp. ZSDZ34]|jgi:hypothetical protein|uniref:DUF2804 domain-containing protein n=1 Tax=Vibrio gelatinilyticus TaxID=2893468 RepID=A0A9X1W889_9VIBR|nr:DUF2804 domain-containing protein [Vibrio gelatinilyticus]MCJ2375276.1 DUF2804 domain-containing protein [Vibrio gelatinilyticus]